jgi:hypothetical protein
VSSLQQCQECLYYDDEDLCGEPGGMCKATDGSAHNSSIDCTRFTRRYATRDSFECGRQPCDAFDDSPEWNGLFHQRHECPRCLQARMFCGHCHTDHHQGGWDTCKEL